MTWGAEASSLRPRDAIARFIVFLLQLFDASRANAGSGVFPHVKTCLLYTNMTTRNTLTILNTYSVMISKMRSLALVLYKMCVGLAEGDMNGLIVGQLRAQLFGENLEAHLWGRFGQAF